MASRFLDGTKVGSRSGGSVNLTGAKLKGADLSGAGLSQANLSNVDLSKAKLAGAFLRGANLTGANLTDAKFNDADLGNGCGGIISILHGETPQGAEVDTNGNIPALTFRPITNDK